MAVPWSFLLVAAVGVLMLLALGVVVLVVWLSHDKHGQADGE